MKGINKMTKDELREVDEKIRYFEKKCDDACEKALADGNMEELDRLEDLLRELIKIDGVVYSRIQNMRW